MKPFYSFLLSLLVICCFSCQASTSNSESDEATAASAEIPDGPISNEQFSKLLSSYTKPQLIDVRTPEEFEAGQIDGAVNIDFYNEDFSNQLTGFDKSRPIFVYCKSGGRSGKTYNMLKGMGVRKVYDLQGGYDGWK